MKRAHVLPAAEAESDAAFEWYWAESESAALGFDAELRTAIKKLLNSLRSHFAQLKASEHRLNVVVNYVPVKLQQARLPLLFRDLLFDAGKKILPGEI